MKTALKHPKALIIALLVCAFLLPMTSLAVDNSDLQPSPDASEVSMSELSDVSAAESADVSDGTSSDSSVGTSSDAPVSDASAAVSVPDTSETESEESGSIIIADEDYVRVGIFITSAAATQYVVASKTGFEYGYSDDVYFTKVSDTSTKKVTVVSSGTNTVQLYDSNGKFIYEFAEKDGKALAIRAKDYDVLTPVKPRINADKSYDYEGYFEFPRLSYTNGSAMRMINVVELETYVLCVLACEVSRSAPLEAMKAQTLCIRSLVLSEGSSKKHLDCNICAATDCQAYYGTSAIEALRTYHVDIYYNRMVEAVNATKGEYMIYTGPGEYNGIIVQAAYHGSSGGSTVSAKSFWGVQNAPYSVAVRIPEETGTYMWGCSVVTLEDITNATNLNDFKNSSSSWKREIYALGDIASVEILEHEKNSDHVIKLRITDVDGKSVTLNYGDRVYYFIHRVVLCCSDTYEAYKDKDEPIEITSTIISSSNFTLTPINQSALNIRLETANGTAEMPSDEAVKVLTASGEAEYTMPGSTTVITSSGKENAKLTSDVAGYELIGKGWAHCVGYGQNGANDLAELEYTYEQILKRFFTDIDVVNMEEMGYEFSYDN